MVKLVDISRPKQWKTISGKDLLDKGYPVYGANGLIGYWSNYNHEKETITIGCRGTCGEVNIIPAKSYINGNAMCLDDLSNDVELRYLYYYLKWYDLKKIISGSTIPQITVEGLKKVEVKVFAKERQKEIINVLDTLSAVIEKRQMEVEKLEQLIKARFVEMFGDENNSKGYPVIKLQEVADVQVGVVIKPAQYYTDEANGVRAFRSLNIGEMHVKDCDWVYFNDEGQKKNAKSILRENDLVIVRSGAPGTACVVTKEYEGSNAVDVLIAHPNTEKINPYYLCAYTNYPHGKHQIKAGTGGAAQQHFNVGKYKDMDLIYPSKQEQDEFVAFVEQIDKSKTVIQKSLDRTQLLFDSLMQEYFGE